MSDLDILFFLSGATVLMSLFGGRVRHMGWLLTAAYGVQIFALMQMSGLVYEGGLVDSTMTFNVFGLMMSWRFNALSWFFALITLGAALASSFYMSGEWGEYFKKQGGPGGLLHLALAINVLSMLLLIGSGDFLSLFVGWELVSWASFMMMLLARSGHRDASLRYITYATAGAMALLAGLALVFDISGSLQYEDFLSQLPQLGNGQIIALVLLFGSGFAVKMALLPFHLWQVEAYAQTPGPGMAFMGAISSRMGFYAIIVVLVQLIGMERIADIDVPLTFLDSRDLIAWLGVLTIILPTFVALKQTDARRLLAWHGIGQGGYMLLGIATASEIGTAGGIMHVINHAIYQAALILAVHAVIMRTGTSDLNRLGGLVARMPLSFLVMLIGIIGLAGLPPMSGFVSKWMIYRSLIDQGSPLLFIGAVIGTLGTILSVYKLMHNTFLGQLRLEHENISEAPWSMTIPMLVLASLVLLTGIMPGLVLDWVVQVQLAVGLAPVQPTLGGIENGLDMIWVGIAMFYGIGIGALLFFMGNRSKRVHQLDTYAGGHFLTADSRYHYSDHFYAGLMRVTGNWYRGSFEWLQAGAVSLVDMLGVAMLGFYRNVHPNLVMLVTAVLILGWVVL